MSFEADLLEAGKEFGRKRMFEGFKFSKMTEALGARFTSAKGAVQNGYASYKGAYGAKGMKGLSMQAGKDAKATWDSNPGLRRTAYGAGAGLAYSGATGDDSGWRDAAVGGVGAGLGPSAYRKAGEQMAGRSIGGAVWRGSK